MRRNKEDRVRWAYRMTLLKKKLNTAIFLHSKATLDEWEAAEVARLLKVQNKGWTWKNARR